MARGADLRALEGRLGHRFSARPLLHQALTHGSALDAPKDRERPSYERLEFLGDRVLALVVADLLYARFPDEPEGALAARHAQLVRAEALARVAATIDLGPHVELAASERDRAGAVNPTILADVCEAVIAALYLDGGLAPAHAFIARQWTPLIEESAQPPKDPKTALQEWAQGRGHPLPEYGEVGRVGPAHAPHFRVEARAAGEAAVGEGRSKQAAERAAAQALLDRLVGTAAP